MVFVGCILLTADEIGTVIRLVGGLFYGHGSEGRWQNIPVKVERVGVTGWRTCLCLQSRCKFSKNKPRRLPESSCSPSRVTRASVAAAAAARSEQSCGSLILAASGCNVLMCDGDWIILDPMAAHVSRDGL